MMCSRIRVVQAIVMMAVCAMSLYAHGDDVVHRRGSEAALIGDVERVTANGVTIRTGSGASAVHEVPWDMVRDVVMDNPPNDLQRRLDDAQNLWRARSRLQRGDAAMAETLFDRIFEKSRGETHETALITAEGLLRCRLKRYDLPSAVIPALEVARLQRAGVSTDRYERLEQVFDEATSLCIVLPPALMAGRSAQRLERELSRYDPGGDEIVAALAALYAASLEPDTTQMEALQFSRDASRHPGVRLLHTVIEASRGDDAARHAARTRLLRDLSSLDDWSEAWARYGLGLSYLREENLAHVERGAVHLSHIPARFARQQPYLAGLAVNHLRDLMASWGDHEAAASLQAELQRRFPFHPIRLESD